MRLAMGDMRYAMWRWAMSDGRCGDEQQDSFFGLILLMRGGRTPSNLTFSPCAILTSSHFDFLLTLAQICGRIPTGRGTSSQLRAGRAG
jgi:hypothetical protein